MSQFWCWWLMKTDPPHPLLFLMTFTCWWRMVCRNPALSPCLIRLEGKWITASGPQCVIVSQRWRITAIIRHFLKFPTQVNNQHKAYLHAWGHICIANSARCRHVCSSTVVIVPTVNFLDYFPEAIKKIADFSHLYVENKMHVCPVTHFIISPFSFVWCRHLECSFVKKCVFPF